ncbi:BCS1 N terminal-domain-containing protein [Cercophora newfieldiana]|uniref:BCS1 N terminal-domain-containing protein n=1 Tax=Cercophora newfieldiana TaxID=92897 RepID=A0AA39Y8M3_9PEZI|nr:BCS1 N terminal-domain-containing protein [Cercophora newfieldiana]
MNSLLALAGTTSLLGARPGTASFEQLEERIPGFGVLQNFFKSWLGVDLTTVLTAAALMGAASSGVRTIQASGSKVYWWIIRFLTASISIAGKDRLNREVLNWLGAHVLTTKGTRVLTAHSETIQTDAWHHRRVLERNDYHHEKRVPVQYLPTFGATWFIHGRNLFMVRRILTTSSHYKSAWGNQTPDEYSGAPQGDEPLVVMCLGRSVEPIKKFLDSCRVFADKQREAFVTVRASKARSYEESWDTTILRPLRPLETVHFDEKIKAELVADLENYLDPSTRKFYNGRGIPYRRGYLFYGPPGTGKTSLSLALAGMFGLELYLLHVPSVSDDRSLEKLFAALPPRCMVLLEDIDAVGIKRRPGKSDDSDDEKDDKDSDSEEERNLPSSRCTLAGLLNVLDGVASQEGRIVLMTSNFAEKLDKALVRPGRVDRIIYLGNISPRSSELMFMRMYSRNDEGQAPAGTVAKIPEAELTQLALSFSKEIPDEVLTPAQLQGYLLNYREAPVEAAANIRAWVAEERRIMDAAKEKARKAAEKRRKRRRENKLKAYAKMASQMGNGLGSDAELEALERRVQNEKMKRHLQAQKKNEPQKTNGKTQVKAPVTAVGKRPLPGNAASTNGVQETRTTVPSRESAAERVLAGNAASTNGIQETQKETDDNGEARGSESTAQETEKTVGDPSSPLESLSNGDKITAEKTES